MNNKPWDARLAYRLIYPLRNSRVTPNHLTSVRLLFGIFACAGLSTGDYFWVNIGAFCFVISNFLDHSDGELARLTGKMSKSGHYFDLASDAIVNILLFVGIGAGLMHGSLGNWALLMGVVSGLAVAAIFHMRNEIEKSVGKTDARQPNIGVIEAEDVLYLLPVITLAGWLVPFLILAVIGAPVYALWTLKEFRDHRVIQS
jgi:archaetidylinositol phosphate synthase